ncbi:MAG: hypothetical protein JNL84_10565 [Candidatus Accumulibacter sp.]|nr:hypothetical protein [Accumulibacter sp.]
MNEHLNIAKAIARVGDHDTHIVEHIIYCGNDEDIRRASDFAAPTEK